MRMPERQTFLADVLFGTQRVDLTSWRCWPPSRQRRNVWQTCENVGERRRDWRVGFSAYEPTHAGMGRIRGVCAPLRGAHHESNPGVLLSWCARF